MTEATRRLPSDAVPRGRRHSLATTPGRRHVPLHNFINQGESRPIQVGGSLQQRSIAVGDIGNPVKTVEFEPMPESAPVVEPAAPAVPAEPVPA